MRFILYDVLVRPSGSGGNLLGDLMQRQYLKPWE